MSTRPLRTVLLASLVAAAGGIRAHAAVLDASATTLLQGRSEPADGQVRTVVPIIEIVGLSATRIDNPLFDDLGFQLDLWGRTNLSGEAAREADRLGQAADVNLLYGTGKLFDRRLTLTAGRHMVYGGAARALHVDGASADFRFTRRFGLQAYSGLAVIPRFAYARSDWLAGGRLYYAPTIDTSVGASFIQVHDRGAVARQDAGFDARWVLPGRAFTVGALALFSLAAERLSEADAFVEYRPNDRWELRADVRRTAPDLFLPLTSIFTVFAGERRDEVGGSVSFTPWRQLNLWADYHYLVFDAQVGEGQAALAGENGHQGTLRATWSLGPGALVGAQARVLTAPVNGYLSGRVFGMGRLTDRIGLSLDLDSYHFQDPVNGQPASYVASASGTYQVADGWLAALTGLASVTPYFEHRFEVLAKLVYNFSTRVREVTP